MNISAKSHCNFLCIRANKQTIRQINTGYHITSLAKVIKLLYITDLNRRDTAVDKLAGGTT